MKNHADALIFQSAICAGASQISLDGRRESDIRVAPSRKRSGMGISMEKYKDLGGIHSMDGEKNIDPLVSM